MEKPQNPIQKAHLEGMKLFDKTFPVKYHSAVVGGFWLKGREPTPDDIKSFLTTYAQNLLNAAKEAGPGEVSNYAVNKEIKEKNLRKTEEQWAARAKAHGHNSCRLSYHSTINEGIKEIKKGNV